MRYESGDEVLKYSIKCSATELAFYVVILVIFLGCEWNQNLNYSLSNETFKATVFLGDALFFLLAGN